MPCHAMLCHAMVVATSLLLVQYSTVLTLVALCIRIGTALQQESYYGVAPMFRRLVQGRQARVHPPADVNTAFQ